MNNIEKLYENIKGRDDENIREILKNIIIIDGAIVQDGNLKYKKETLVKIEQKYKKELEDLSYHKLKKIVEDKTDEFVESDIKAINTELGNLKNMLIRILGTKMYTNNKIEEIKNKIKKENDTERISELYLELDEVLVEHIK